MRVGPIEVVPLPEAAVVQLVERAWSSHTGGWIATANVDIARAATRDAEAAALLAEADLVVPDGMPIVWAARLAGHRVPERVTGSSLVFSLAEAAARTRRSVYLLGGEPGVPEAAAKALTERYPGLLIAGTDSPPVGFDRTADGMADVVHKVVEAQPDLVLAGLGFPKQERTIRRLRAKLPDAWYVGCGAGIPMAAGQFRRAPELAQRVGAEWVHRLALEPRRLAGRYLRDDAPFAARLLTGALLRRAAAHVDPKPARFRRLKSVPSVQES
ncbi:WecB/TagA/CpsF family glycosyltransferase [Amycolatopsis aidingensis]|uniref:WecB/TagA/CpsF family glycosyltransferase n=1 Tax=Amycolatopsis aidingensis TaxID=2842453 RepID=UPI001E2D9990|nr:WecB/TagA/CpsF family glycosyltransferase [Amycolatopsis aidingensis]